MQPAQVLELEQQITFLPRAEQLLLLERIIHRLRQDDTTMQDLDRQLEAMAADPEIQREMQSIHDEFAPTQQEPPDTPSVYTGSPLSLDDMEEAVHVETGKHI